MKLNNLFIVSLLITIFTISSNAQNYTTGLGLRFGYDSGITLKHFYSSSNAGEFLVTVSPNYFHLAGLYEYHKPFGGVKNMYWYIGVGGHIGSVNKEKNKKEKNRLSIGPDFIGGFEFVFPKVPLVMSLDWKPTFNYISNNNDNWYSPLTLSLRYVLK